MNDVKPFSQACENNRQPILSVLQRAFADCSQVLEIGSGSGQHAVFFAPQLQHLVWQPSDRPENLPGIQAWISDEPSSNLSFPLELDVDGLWPDSGFDGFFTANTCHIMPWTSVINMFAGIGKIATADAVLAIYGPFKYQGGFTTDSNANFDRWLKSIVPHQGVRDIEKVTQLAQEIGFKLVEDNAMPANNQLLLFRR